VTDKRSNKDRERMTLYFQVGTGVFAVLSLAFGFWGYVAGSVHPFIVGMAIRVGATLAVISLAMPQLVVLRRRLPSIALGCALVAMFLIAAQPRIGRVLVGILVIALTANTAVAWLASMTGKK